MKRITVLLIVLSMLLCLFACKKSEENNGDISDDSTISQNISSGTDEEDRIDYYDYGRQYVRFESFDEYVNWYNSGEYLSDYYVDKNGERFVLHLELAKKIQDGERFLYEPYFNGEAVNDGVLTILDPYKRNSHIVTYYFRTKDENKTVWERKNICSVLIRYLDDEFKNNEDIAAAYSSLLNNDIKKIDKEAVTYKNKKKDVLTSTRTVDVETEIETTYITYISKFFVLDGLLVAVEYKEGSDFNLQDFLDGFELRPIELTTFSTAEKE